MLGSLWYYAACGIRRIAIFLQIRALNSVSSNALFEVFSNLIFHRSCTSNSFPWRHPGIRAVLLAKYCAGSYESSEYTTTVLNIPNFWLPKYHSSVGPRNPGIVGY